MLGIDRYPISGLFPQLGSNFETRNICGIQKDTLSLISSSLLDPQKWLAQSSTFCYFFSLMATESGLKRARSSISSVVLYNIKDENEEWIPQVYRKYSWVTMQPGNRGQYRVKGKASEDLAKHWKGRILDFKMAPGGKTVKEVLIQHVFMQKEINVGPLEGLPRHRPHCKCLCSVFQCCK